MCICAAPPPVGGPRPPTDVNWLRRVKAAPAFGSSRPQMALRWRPTGAMSTAETAAAGRSKRSRAACANASIYLQSCLHCRLFTTRGPRRTSMMSRVHIVRACGDAQTQTQTYSRRRCSRSRRAHQTPTATDQTTSPRLILKRSPEARSTPCI